MPVWQHSAARQSLPHLHHFLLNTIPVCLTSSSTSLRLNLFSYFLAVIMHVLAHRAIKRMFFDLDDRSSRLTHSCALIRKTHTCKRGLPLLYTHPRGSWGAGGWGVSHVSLCCVWGDRNTANTEIFDKRKEGEKNSIQPFGITAASTCHGNRFQWRMPLRPGEMPARLSKYQLPGDAVCIFALV